MRRTLFDIKNELKTLLPIIEEKYAIDKLEIFGSFTTNEATEGSDLDLLVTFKITPTLLKFIELKNFLSEQLGINVDLVLKDSIKESIKESILKEVIPV